MCDEYDDFPTDEDMNALFWFGLFLLFVIILLGVGAAWAVLAWVL